MLAVGGFVVEDKKQFWFSYLLGFMWALAISLGALFWNMVHHLTAAGWSVVLRRNFENVARAIPVLFVLFLPLAFFGLDHLYSWTGMSPEEAAALPAGKRTWLSKEFFVARVCGYFAVWIAYSLLMRKWSLQMDATESPEERKAILKKCEWYAPSGVALLGLTATFAAFDLVMSLNYAWFSTIFGVIFWADCIRASLASSVLILITLRSLGYLRNTLTSEHLHDMGKLMFGFTVFWTYVSFAQYFLYWYGNIPEETKFYNDRRVGTWYPMSVMLVICYFVVPFIALMPRGNKRNPKVIGFVAGWVVFFQLYHLYWEIMPESLKANAHAVPASGVSLHWLNLVAVVGFLGVVVSSLLYGWANYPLIPVRDPRLHESLHHEVDEFGDPQAA